MSTPILALDLAVATGWALRDEQGRLTSGVQSFPLRRGESPGMRFLRFRKWYREMLELGTPLVVAFEAPLAGGRGFAMGVARELVAFVLEGAAEYGIETTSIYPSTLKKHATGKGNSKKAAMIVAARARWGVDVTDDNEADALLVLAWAIEELGEK